MTHATVQIIERLGRGGAERLVVDTANALNARGNPSIVLSRSGLLSSQIAGGWVEVPEGPRRSGWESALDNVHSAYEILHVHSTAPLIASARFARGSGKLCVFSVHGWTRAKYLAARPLLAIARPDLVIGVSTGVVDQLRRVGIPATCVPNGVPDRGARPNYHDDEVCRFVSVGRFDRQKRHDIMLQAFAQTYARVQNVRLELFGDGPLVGEMKAMARSLGIGDSVTFHGFQDPYPTLVQSDCYVTSSDYEGLSLAQIEALMAGLPIISTATAGVESIVRGENGYVVPIRDAAALARGMYDFAVTRPGSSMGRVSRDIYLESFTQDSYIDSLLRAYARAGA